MARGQRAALVAFDGRARLVADLGADRVALERALDSLEPGYGATDFSAALAAAERVLQQSSAPNREIVLVSDLQKSGFYPDRLPKLPADIVLRVMPVDPAPRANVRVTRVEVLPDGSGSAPNRRIVRATVRNDGAQIARDVSLEVVLNDFTNDTRTLAIEPGGEAIVESPVILPADRTARIRVSAHDTLAGTRGDFYLAAEPEPVADILVATSDDRRENTRVFLRQAFSLSRYPIVRAEFADGAALTADALNGRSIVLIDGIDPSGESYRGTLRDYVAGGGALVVFVTDRPQAWAEDSDFLPGSLQPDAAGTGSALTGIELAGGHPLGDTLARALRRRLIDADVFRHRTLVPGPADRVLARFTNGQPALLERAGSAGRVLALTTGLAPSWSNLAYDPAFAPLVIETIRYLVDQHAPAQYVHVGDRISLARAGASGRVVVESPDGETASRGPDEGVYTPRVPGFHEVHAIGAGSSRTVAVNVNPVEHDAQTVDGNEFSAQLVRTSAAVNLQGAQTAAVSARDDPSRPLWWILLGAAIALFAVETYLANRRAGGGNVDSRATT
jgi:hypothetical protein